jgi:HAD superfamily phosphatase
MTPERVGVAAFDLDGVLVDVRGSFRVAIGRTLAAFGGAAAEAGELEALKRAGGYNNDWDVTRELLRRRGIEVERARVVEVFTDFYRGRNGRGPGLIEQERWLLPQAALAALERRYRLALFTGRPRQDAEFTLRRFGAEAAFASVVALEDVALQKPSPEGLERIRARHAPLELMAYVGDTIDDAHAAAAAGVPFYAVCEAEGAAAFRAAGAQWMGPSAAAAASVLLGKVGGETRAD